MERNYKQAIVTINDSKWNIENKKVASKEAVEVANVINSLLEDWVFTYKGTCWTDEDLNRLIRPIF